MVCSDVKIEEGLQRVWGGPYGGVGSGLVVFGWEEKHIKERVKRSAHEGLVNRAKVRYPDVPEENLPLAEFNIHGLEDQVLIMNDALLSKTGFYVRGLGVVGNGLLTKIKGPQPRADTTVIALEATQKAMEDVQAAAKEAVKKANATTLEAQAEFRKVFEQAKARDCMLLKQIMLQERSIMAMQNQILRPNGGQAALVMADTATVQSDTTAPMEEEVWFFFHLFIRQSK